MLRLLSRLLSRLLLVDGAYLRRKLLLTPVIVGPEDRVHLGEMTDLQDVILNTNSGHIHIGDHTFFGHGCRVLTGRHDPSLRERARQQEHPQTGGDIHIGRGVWVASGVTILGGVRIADHSVIAAGAVVTGDCLEPAIYAGVPARRVADLPTGRGEVSR